MTDKPHRAPGSANVHPRVAISLAVILAVAGTICAVVAVWAAQDGDASALYSTMAIAGWGAGVLSYRRRRPGPFDGWGGYLPIIVMLLGASAGSLAYSRDVSSAWIVLLILAPVSIGYVLEAAMDGAGESLPEGRRKSS